jgi:hypothetical protein
MCWYSRRISPAVSVVLGFLSLVLRLVVSSSRRARDRCGKPHICNRVVDDSTRLVHCLFRSRYAGILNVSRSELAGVMWCLASIPSLVFLLRRLGGLSKRMWDPTYLLLHVPFARGSRIAGGYNRADMLVFLNVLYQSSPALSVVRGFLSLVVSSSHWA